MPQARQNRPIRLVGRHPEAAQRTVALTDGTSFFEILERQQRVDGPWLHLQNMELKVSQWFRLEDCAELRLAGNAARIKERKGWT